MGSLVRGSTVIVSPEETRKASAAPATVISIR